MYHLQPIHATTTPEPGRTMPGFRVLCLAISVVLLHAADQTPAPAQEALALASSAHRIRLDAAREAAGWTVERQRLEALIRATEAETARLVRDADLAERSTIEAQARLAALGSGSDLDVLRLRLADAGTELARGLAALAVRLPPGAIVAPTASGGESAFDAGIRSLEAAERSAGVVTIEVVTGTRDGCPEAVKLLRVAGAAAWWVSLDGLSSGTVRLGTAQVELVSAGPDIHAAIVAALGQVEGRSAPGIALLPGGAP